VEGYVTVTGPSIWVLGSASDGLRRVGQVGGPFGGFADVGKLGSSVGADAGLEWNDRVEHAEGVFAHFGACEKLRCFFGEVQAELESVRRDGDTDVVIGQKQPAVAAGDGAAGVEEPGFGAGGINVQELEQLFFELPEAEQAFLRDTEGAQINEGAEKREEGVGVTSAVKRGEFETALQA